MTEPEHIPTIEELAKRGLATVVLRNGKGDPTAYRYSDAGQQLVYDIMARNAQLYRERPDLMPHKTYTNRRQP